ncbi:MAG: hypothetical protein LLG37_04535 [Spirochaetia bacterium]|nr:hypothetical protein [Spirochaetia bacterium]
MKRRILAAALLFCVASAGVASDSGGYITGLVTTCTGIINSYPADTTNWFFRGQHKVIQYYAYFIFPRGSGAGTAVKPKPFLFINPYELYSGKSGYRDEDNYVFENRWISPTGKTIGELVVSWNKNSATDKITVDSRDYVTYKFINYMGLTQTIIENGQERLPDETGLYHINLYINGELAAVTFFEMKD